MSVFFDNNITDVGRQLWAEMQAGGSFVPTRIVIGSGYMPSGKTSRTMTAVAEPVSSIEINKAHSQPGGDFVIGGMFSNKDITQSFYYRELALYGKVKRANGTETAETLYSYGNAGENAELMPAYGAGTAIERQLDLLVYIGNDANVVVEVKTGVYVDRDEFNEAIAGITPVKIGAISLGMDRTEIPEGADLNDYLRIGGFRCSVTETALTVKNCPVPVAFIMDVVSATGNEEEIDVNDFRYLMQRIYSFNGTEYFRLVSSNKTGVINYGEWEHKYSSFQPPHPTEIGAVSTHSLVQEADLVAWATKQTLSGSFLVSPDNTTENLPPNSVVGDWLIGFLDVTNAGKRITVTALNTMKQHVNVTRGNVFMGWVEQYNAFNLPPTTTGVVPATVE